MLNIRPSWISNADVRLALSVWHEVVTDLEKSIRVFECIGHEEPARRLRVYHDAIIAHAELHLKGLALTPQSLPTETGPLVEDAATPSVSTGSTDANVGPTTTSEHASGAAAVDLDREVWNRVESIGAKFPERKRAAIGHGADLEQQIEMAEKHWYQARRDLRDGRIAHAEQQVTAAEELLYAPTVSTTLVMLVEAE